MTTYTLIVSDGIGGWIISWEDYRNYNVTGIDLFAQHVDSSATLLWTAEGVAVSTETGSQSGKAITTDGEGGAVVMWQTNNSYVSAQRINSDGTLTNIDSETPPINNPELPGTNTGDPNSPESPANPDESGGGTGLYLLLLLLAQLIVVNKFREHY